MYKMKSKGYPVHQLMFGATSQTELDKGTFVVPTALELPNLDDLQREEVADPASHRIINFFFVFKILIE